MNCKQVENLLPLYVSRDLSEKREGLVAAHLHTCAKCKGAVAEYRETGQLLQEFAPPAFSEDVFAEIRRNVWRKLETESASPSMPEVIVGWFRPRLPWAVATALLLAVSFVGIYFFAGRNSARREVVVSAPKIQPHEKPAPSLFASSEGISAPRAVNIRRPERGGDRNRAPERAVARVASAPNAPGTRAASATNNPAELNSSAAQDSGKTLRMEIQTKDPNIRIIWFAQRDSKPASSISKGT